MSQRQVRLDKLQRLRDAEVPVYPDRFAKTHTIAEAAGLEVGTTDVALAGRMVSRRVMGKMTFAHLADFGGKLQIAVQQDRVGKFMYKHLVKRFDLGDFVGIKGSMIRTRTGELTLRADEVTFLGKALRPLPEKWHGMKDQELRYRRRYLDLLSNEKSREVFKLRTRLIRTIRDFLDAHDFFEVETPVLQNKPSGALARPFTARHNALGIDVYLRIAPETYLKRCVVGGFERVYEFARCFRNEGIDASHLQDFTMLEYYAAFWNYEDNMRFTQRLFQHFLGVVLGSEKVTFRGNDIDFSGEWPRVTFSELIAKDCGISLSDFPTAEALLAEIRERGIDLEHKEPEKLGRGNLIDALYKKVCRPKLIQPTFLTAHPTDISPLARKNDENPHVTDRFQLVAGGWEIVNAYSELVDPLDQRARMEVQAAAREKGDEEALDVDEDYLLAMEYGMPPMSGWGMGIDRMVALLMDLDNLRDTVLFPLMRQTEGQELEGLEEA